MINGEVLYECGVDLNSSFEFKDGDIEIISYEENLVQAITNRLNTGLNTLDLFYTDYGSVLTGFLGWKSNEKTLQYIKNEIDNALSNESRLVEYISEVFYDSNGVIKINLTLYTSSQIGLEVNLVLGTDGVVEVESDENEIEEDIEEI